MLGGFHWEVTDAFKEHMVVLGAFLVVRVGGGYVCVFLISSGQRPEMLLEHSNAQESCLQQRRF